ncbi:uncharacterized protein BP01DRAFT_355354 [Aspergillus saccharolyticus JOP 1030-1]|uniref:Uncharacterized protein n=1 Tax=Aspergillus saccharolyticus JOP 1030-1 TaxID=1450539 RepID=A0A318ZJA0_9EURO|nr:hypothetical protein BP01DRAFT_355354 [Aspergillus saccharolyticus JOP 1030-1]PYH46945.1 hypothetical protein BP01DRAFT_355354 [Aspergillus saccharolyticus JOP 1030-1]
MHQLRHKHTSCSVLYCRSPTPNLRHPLPPLTRFLIAKPLNSPKPRRPRMHAEEERCRVRPPNPTLSPPTLYSVQ